MVGFVYRGTCLTDGLLEAHGTNGEEFSLEWSRELLVADAPSTSPKSLCERFFEALDAHTGGALPSGDATLQAVRAG
jgi:serine phosphatase RsbU (regulator of sigma subunit)